MKKVILISLFLPILSCGVKKELASAEQEKVELEKRLTEIEKKQAELKEQNQALINQNREYSLKINQLIKQRQEYITTNPSIESIYSVVEKMPQFPGGEAKMLEFLGKNTKYPNMAKEANVQGKVYVQFIVETDGSITNIKVLRGIGSGCDQEAMRVVKSMPNWIPGEQRGKKVRVTFNLPMNFVLR